MAMTKSNTQGPVTSGQLQRRGLMAGVAALAGAGLAKLLGPGRAEAGHDGTNVFHLGVGDNLWGTAYLSGAAPSNPMLRVRNSGTGTADAIAGIIPPGGSTSAIGVSGRNDAGGTGVQGIGNAGVLGGSDTIGVQGYANNGHGVFGQTFASAGTVVSGMLAAGLTGRTSSTIALYGYSEGPANPSYAPVGAVGQCENGFGVWGLSSAGPGATSRPGAGNPTAVSGVLGTSASNVGVYAISSGSYALAADGNGPNTVGVLGRGLGGGKAAVFVGNVEVQGHLTVTGGINGPVAAAPVEGGPAAQLLTNPEPLVALGDGQLAAGRAAVRLEPAFAAALADERYRVFLTEYDDHHALYVTRRTREGFEVRAKDAPTASGTFSYRVVGQPRSAPGAGDRATTPLHTPTLPVPQGVPTLPVGPAPAPALPARDPRPASPR
jgi:hypothetical protein